MCSSTSRPSGPAATRTPARSGSVRRWSANPLASQRVDALHLARRGRGIGGDDGRQDAATPAEWTDSAGAPPVASLMRRVYDRDCSRRTQPEQAHLGPRRDPEGDEGRPEPPRDDDRGLASHGRSPRGSGARRAPGGAFPRRRQADLAAVQVPAQHEVGRPRRELLGRLGEVRQEQAQDRAASEKSLTGRRMPRPPTHAAGVGGRPPRCARPKPRSCGSGRFRSATCAPARVVDDRAGARTGSLLGTDVVVPEHRPRCRSGGRSRWELLDPPAAKPGHGSRCRRSGRPGRRRTPRRSRRPSETHAC